MTAGARIRAVNIDEASPFLQVNAVAQRARALIRGEAARTRIESRQPTAIALAELREGALQVQSPEEAKQLLATEVEGETEEERAATEATRASFEAMWPDPEDAPEEA